MKISNMLPKTTLAEKLDKTGDSKDNIITFTNTDSTTANAWTDVNLLASGEKHSSILNKISTMFKNVRFLYKMLGTTDISAIGDGTVRGAIAAQNETFTQQISVLSTNLAGKAAASHNHDTRYYTKAQVNALVPAYAGTLVVTVGAGGVILVGFSTVGITSRPVAAIATPQSFNGYMCYIFDESSELLKFNVYGQSGESVIPVSQGTTVRFGLVIYK